MIVLSHHRFGPTGKELYLRRKRPAGQTCGVVLMMHGSTLPGSLAFDLALDGHSWMDDLAKAGQDVWSLDLRGYGLSWRPEPIVLADGREVPLVRTDEAIADLEEAVRHIISETGSAVIDLIGWSWGSTIVAATAGRKKLPLRRIILHAPQWIRETPSAMVNSDALQHSYRTINPQAMRDRWFLGLSDKVKSIVEERSWDRAYLSALSQMNDLRVPNGTIQDIAEYWDAGRPFYDPARIEVPVSVIVGNRDRDTPPSQAKALLQHITTPQAELTILPEGTHFALFEPVRDALFDATREFLARK